MAKYNTEIFIDKANKKHNNKYNYKLVEYINASSPVKIICLVHGIFEQTPVGHLRGRGCPSCSGKNKTTKQFVGEANIIHNNKYNYSKVNYVNATTPITIICSIHGEFKQKPSSHLLGYGCRICGGNVRLTIEKFLEKAIVVHKNKYNYSKVKYFNSHQKVIIICPLHGEFKQKPNNHLNGANCPKCAKINFQKNRTLSQLNFIEKANKLHHNKYDYSQTNYISHKHKINIICPIHGKYSQLANSHLNGHGCPNCNESKGELKIKEILKKKNVIFIFQKTFNDCRNKNNKKLKFDFYLQNKNILIEYDGRQHYEPIEYFGGIISHEKLVEYDKIKNQYAEHNKIKLIRISYIEYENIDEILNFI
jgi:hypothetical protein